MKKIPHCKNCDQDGHYTAFCRQRLVKPKTLKTKPLLRKATKQPKKPSRSKIKKELDKLVKDYVKERDNYTCQWCGKKVSGKSCQGSHVFSIGSCSSLQFEPLNIKVLCAYCHRRRWHSSPPEAMAWFASKFPERLTQLEKLKLANKKTSTYSLQMLVNEYKAKGL